MEIFQNRILITVIAAWAIAQVTKTIIYYLLNGKFDPSRLTGDGGMPSCHSATVTSCATAAAMVYGLNSFEFTIAAVLAIIVMHDAMSVRLESGKQAKAINDLRKYFEDLTHIKITDKELKELLGHTPLQVVAGALLGLIVALVSFSI
ncbi:MAG: divergent PAP2 family protein [Erysipelotrichaceae bacterium]|nr:divergent PAP2 family protein [Erysipelotrichaceae bacterium]